MLAVSGMACPVTGVIFPDHWVLVMEGTKLKEKSPWSPPSQLPLVVKVPEIVLAPNFAVRVVALLLLRIMVIVRLSPMTSPVIEARGEQRPKPVSWTNLALIFVPVWTMNMSTIVGKGEV